MKHKKRLIKLKIVLSIDPPIWRRVVVSDESKFSFLHTIIQDSMGWLNQHQYEFQVLNPITGTIESLGVTENETSWDGLFISSEERSLKSMIGAGETQITYIYDYGDNWVHRIQVEDVNYQSENSDVPFCIDGEGKCPSEDSGGIENYVQSYEKFNADFVLLSTLPSLSSLERTTQHEIWLRRILQCDFTLEKITHELSSRIKPEDIAKLYNTIRTGDLRHRNRAIGILSHYKEIPRNVLQEHLFIPGCTVDSYVERYARNGIDEIVHQKKRTSKYDNPQYSEKILEVLHAPPSDHGFNRTSWRLDDIMAVMAKHGMPISKNYVSKLIRRSGFNFLKAKIVLTSTDPNYREKVDNIKKILENLKGNEKFFSIDEYGPIAIKIRGGRSLSQKGNPKVVPQWQISKGSLIVTAALELSTNRITHFYSEKKNTKEMIKLLDLLLVEYKECDCLYLSWDAASWHISSELNLYIDKLNSQRLSIRQYPKIQLTPLPSCAQFLNVIESVFSGLARAIIHNSDYESVEDCKKAIDRYITDRNKYFVENPKKAGKKIWGKERVSAEFRESNTCKDPAYR